MERSACGIVRSLPLHRGPDRCSHGRIPATVLRTTHAFWIDSSINLLHDYCKCIHMTIAVNLIGNSPSNEIKFSQHLHCYLREPW